MASFTWSQFKHRSPQVSTACSWPKVGSPHLFSRVTSSNSRNLSKSDSQDRLDFPATAGFMCAMSPVLCATPGILCPSWR
ncbi:rCG30285 [Rattus norvegicus]|uniref:RCG30285 n=1 Tax=Rattus norvegicus TaxID=10116 RepID=A6IMN7_RAT|nr:rCG30285 [Rattus norvegicus]